MKKNASPWGGFNQPLGGTAAALTAVCLALTAQPVRHASVPRTPEGTMTTYTNPVIDENFPDPSILRDGDTYYAYSTNSGPNLPCRKSTDLVHWTALPDAMPTLPTWAKEGRTWAPTVHTIIPGKRYVAYFCAHDRASDTQALGVAVGPTPVGPFTSDATGPLLDRPELGGEIDPSVFTDDDGSHYLVWKNDGNSRGQDTWLWIQQLSTDGLSLVGSATRLIKQDQAWEGHLVEAPTLWKHGGRYYLFYSANDYAGCSYAMGYAVADSLLGPYTKPRNTAWQASTADVCGPGGQDILTTGDGKTWMVYHMWAKGPGSYRSMSLDPLVWNGDIPALIGPSRRPQPGPVITPESSLLPPGPKKSASPPGERDQR
jgi:beta-xylosidase